MDILKPCIQPVVSCLCIHVGFLFNAKRNVQEMNRTMTDLNAKKTDVKNALREAERNNQQPTEEVNLWLQKVAELEAGVAAVNEEYEQIGHRHPLHNFILPNSWPSIHSCGSRAANFRHEAANLVQERAGITALTRPMGPRRVQHIAGPSSHVGKAIEDNLERVLGYLQDETVGVVGIWGPGGVGKTTLLRRINKSIKDDRNSVFDYVIWVVASKDLQLEKLQNDIADRFKLASSSSSEIFEFLENKNFLLLLDDLWEYVDLNEVGIPDPHCNNNGQNQRKQKVVLTTRSEGVCSSMHVHKAIKVGCLEPAEALQLFREAVGEMVNSDPEIEALKLKEEVAKECDGLPLALLTIGKAMSNKKTVHQWKDALRKLQSHTGAISGMDGVFSHLKISYDSLEDETEKECFLYCSLWPEDHIISEKELIWCWLGHGVIDLEKFETLEAALNRGHSMIENLKEACLLEVVEFFKEAVKMHDVIRDLAIQVVREKGRKWVVKVVNQAGQAKQAVANWKEAEKMFFQFINQGVGHSFRLQPPCHSNLSSLLLTCSFGSLTTDFLAFLPMLKYLDLSYSDCRLEQVQELPAVIGCLSHLEYLRFWCGRISGQLPDELANLSKLKYLILRSEYTKSRIRIPNKVILELRKLLVLDVYGGVLEAHKDPTNDYDVKDMYMAVHRMKSVSVRQLKISSFQNLDLLSHVKVRYLHISNLRTLEAFHPQLLSNAMPQIHTLKITDCAALEKLEMDSSCLPSLKSFLLKRLPKLREIVWTGERPEEVEIEIKNCHELKDVSWVQQFPDVHRLELSDCDGMEYVIAEVEGANPTFDVRQLILKGLPRLRSICDRAIDFPHLWEVQVFRCPELKRLPFKAQVFHNNRPKIKGTQEWWDGLLWEDEGIESVLRWHHFKAKEGPAMPHCKETLRILRSPADAITDMDGLLSRLKISYDSLKDDTERECFLYCSLWPEEYSIEEGHLIWCWLGHGLIDLEEFGTLEAAFKHGHSIIANLKKACLLLDVLYLIGAAVKMHHVVRELAIRIVGERGSKWIVKEVEAAGQANHEVAEWKGADKAFLRFKTDKDTNFWLPHPHCSSLSTLILSKGNSKIDFLGLFPALRCLDLSETHLNELPAIIGDLSELEYLSLLGTISTSELPDEFANLSKLKYLILKGYFSDCMIRIANKVILKLQKLLVLHVDNGVLELDEDPTKDYDVQDVYMALHRMKSVSVWDLKISSLGALELGALELLSHVKVKNLRIRNLTAPKTFHSEVLSKNLAQIVVLEITDCVALEKLVMDSSCLPRLKFLWLKKLPKFREIIWTGVMHSLGLKVLDELSIESCHDLRDVSWVLQFPPLGLLELSGCDGMEYVIAEAKEANPTFDVQRLILKGLPQLRGICDRAIDLPSLYTLDVIDCPALKRRSHQKRIHEESEPVDEESSTEEVQLQ